MEVHRNGAVKSRRKREQKNGKVQVVRVDPRVMKIALRLANKDPRRIRILGPMKVEVIDLVPGGE